ncbi:EAL domain-containing protein [Kovacikia minuta CCNUW1]|uniref:sensor domain-containing protein n=1 Tax=Kovacikia minuta TaxID=2931930 RepID=UPI001CD00B4D|nr:EAL domain-containing protein [Kovacikia minuta]UBF24507.1 EAL domain-containing protein [Kovacikia minuta CCNUW1]
MNPEGIAAPWTTLEPNTHGIFILAVQSARVGSDWEHAFCIVAVNFTCAKLLAIDPKVQFPTPLCITLATEIAASIDLHAQVCIQQQHPIHGYLKAPRRGSVGLTITLFPMLDSSGAVTQIVGICQEVDRCLSQGDSFPFSVQPFQELPLIRQPTIQQPTILQNGAPASLQRQRQLETLIDSLPGIIFACANDAEWSMQYLSQGCLELTGYRSQELVGEDRVASYNEITHPEDLPLVLEAIAQAIANREPYVVEYRIRTKSGQERWFWEKGRGLFAEDGNVLSLEGFITDITDLKQAEKALREKESFLHLVLDNIPLSIFWKDTHSVYLGCNKNFVTSLGVPSIQDILGKTDQALPYTSELATRFRQQDRAVLESGKPLVNLLEQNTIPTGLERWVNANKFPILDSEGRVIGVLGTLEDVSDRLQTEAALRQAEQKYRSIFENVVEGIFQTTPDGHYLTANPMLAKIYGYDTPEELIETLTDIKHQLYVDAKRREEFRQLVQQNETVWGFESQVYRRDGSVIWISENARTVRDETGQILGYEGTVEDITQRKQAEATIRYQAFHDLLTGLPNRMLFNDRLPLALANAERNQVMAAVMFLDLDRFKTINDTLGHAIGDQLLQAVAQRLSACLREGDTISRWGGDEFTLLLPQIHSAGDAAKAAQRIIDALKPAFHLEGHELYISNSIGIALYPNDGTDAQTLLKNADAALYRVKEQGRNGYQFYTPAINSKASELLALESSLHHALERDEFVLYYQPQINTTTWEITRMEALIRWRHPKLGLISPRIFIPLAEENGLIVPIGEWVLRSACAQNKIWLEQGISPLRVAVNLSARQFQQPFMAETVSQILAETGLAPSCLELEVTETTAMQNADFTTAMLKEFQAMGVHISLDDFGTGYSSLGYLKKFPLNTIKIDQSFIQELTTDANDAAITRAVIALGKGLNLSVVAEGVETWEQVEHLRSLDCQEMQGYLFSQPLPAEEAIRFLQKQRLKSFMPIMQESHTLNMQSA